MTSVAYMGSQYHHFLLGFIVNAIVHVGALRPYKRMLKNDGETRTSY